MGAIGGRILNCGAAAVAMLTLVTACGGGADKAGGDTVELRLASIDEVNNNGQSYGPEAFVESLGTISGGRLRVKVTTDYGGGAPDAESKLVKAIATGAVDGGWPSTRSFPGAGITGLSAVEAPMTLTSYAAEKALVSGPVAKTLLSRLDRTGVVGLGLSVGPLRRPFAATAPLLSPADWKGAAFRVYNSPLQAETVRALGGTPKNLGFGWMEKIKQGSLRGAEFDIAQYAHNDAAPAAGNVTANVVLWPKVFVLSLSRKRFDSLTAEQQGWVRQAARQAVTASVEGSYDETTIARGLCDKGVRFSNATPAQLAALRTALQPVLDRLATDPADRQVLQAVQNLVRQHPGPDVPDVPPSCRQGRTGAVPPETVPATVSTLPDGVYRMEITNDEVVKAGLSTADGPAGIWTITVRHGTYQSSCRPIADPRLDCGHGDPRQPIVEVGDLRGVAPTVYFVPNAERLSRLTGCRLPVSETEPGHCGPDDPYAASWTLVGDQLRLSSDLSAEMALKPYRKIA